MINNLLLKQLLILISIFFINHCLNDQSIAGQEQTDNNQKVSIVEISTDEWKSCLGDIITEKLSHDDAIEKLVKYSEESTKEMEMMTLNNNQSVYSLEEKVRIKMKSLSFALYVNALCINDMPEQKENLSDQRNSLERVKSQLSTIIVSSNVIDKSIKNLTEVLDPALSGAFQKTKIPELTASQNENNKTKNSTKVKSSSKKKTKKEVAKVKEKVKKDFSIKKATDNEKNSMISAVKKELFDPYSAQFGEIKLILDDKFACVPVNAKNKYGGYVGTQHAIVTRIGNTWVSMGASDISEAKCTLLVIDIINNQ
jgi:hypothetical protein